MDIRSQNFEFLRPHGEVFARIGALAEFSVYTDPSNTVAKARIFGERVVDLIFDMYHLPIAPGANLFDKLREDAFRSNSPTILDKLHAVRILGEQGSTRYTGYSRDGVSGLEGPLRSGALDVRDVLERQL
ncbi:MAG: hypothetical protein IPN51_06590 [Chloracidobacterium sp.]|nr:hypothetical protein [Chloracidobacterium sp.]